MTDGFDQALVNAGVALLTNDLSLTVYPGGVSDPIPPAPPLPPPYVVVRGFVEWPAGAGGDALDGVSGSPTVRWICVCVGGGPDATRAQAQTACLAVAQRVRTDLLNQRPAIAGLDLGMIRQEPGAGTLTLDESTGVPIAELVVVYRTFATT